MVPPAKKIIFFAFLLITALTVLHFYFQSILAIVPKGNTAKVNAVMSREINSEITIWGSSTALVHFDAPMMERRLGISCFNLGLNGTPFVQYSGLLKEYIDYSNSKVIVIVVDINGFGSRTALYQSFAWVHHLQNDNIYHSLKKIDQDLVIKSRFVPLYYLTTYDRRFWLQCFKWIYLYPDGKSELDSLGYHPRNYLWQGGDFSNSFHLTLESKVVEDMGEVIDRALERNFQVAVVITPCYEKATNLILNLPEFESKILSLKKENVMIFNYLQSQMASDQSNFYNYTHLNSKGSSLLTEMFIKDLKVWLN